jgi:FMN phosphatase YigB (HAD superfamily)
MVRYLEELWIRKYDLSAVRGVVFDLDDTLLDHKRWIMSKISQTHTTYAKQLPDRAVFMREAAQQLEEGQRAHLFDFLAEKFCLPKPLTEQMIEYYRSVVPTEPTLFSDARPVINSVREMGFKVALLTDNPASTQEQKIMACGLSDLFDATIFTQTLSCGNKPAKAAFDAVSTQLGIPAHNLIMVGDNLYRDIAGALDAGFLFSFCIARKGTFFNFDFTSFNNTFPEYADKYVTIDNLRPLLWYLGTEKKGKSVCQ